jgi:hypothetical protein
MEYNTDFSKWKSVYEPKSTATNKLCITKTSKKQISIKSDSSDKSIADDSDVEEEEEEEAPKDKYLGGQCLLKFKK